MERSTHVDHSPENLLYVCLAAHDWIHAHPRVAVELGLLRTNWLP